jgi:hypothetical protein
MALRSRFKKAAARPRVFDLSRGDSLTDRGLSCYRLTWKEQRGADHDRFRSSS